MALSFIKRKNTVCLDMYDVIKQGDKPSRPDFAKFILDQLEVDVNTLVDIQLHGLGR